DGGVRVVLGGGQGRVSPDGELVGADDFDAQVRQTFENLRTVLEHAGASLDSVVKSTVYLTDMSRIRDFGRIRGEFLAGPPPASSAVQVGALAVPGMQVEVEAIAVV